MKTPIIETERMILRPLSVADANDIYERWTSDDRVSKYVRWCTHGSVKDTIEWLKLEEDNILSDKVYQWGFTLKDSGYLFGSGGINYNEKEGVFELGYNIMHKYWNQGYTTEAAKAILEFAVKELNQNEFIAWYAEDNPASGAVMRKCGFVYENDEIHTKFDGVTSFVSKKHRLIIENTMIVNQTEYTVVKLLGHGKGGYSYLAEKDGKQYVLKQIHHEPCDYYSFGNKIESERNDYSRLVETGIRLPKMLDIDIQNERILKEYIDGPTIYDLVKDDAMKESYLRQMEDMAKKVYAAGLNIDYFPTNFVVQDELIYYIDYECNNYMEEWNFENWGIKYWSKTQEFIDYVNQH